MRIIVYNYYSDQTQTFDGTPVSVEQQLLQAFPWLESGDPERAGDLEGVVEQLDHCQAYSVEIQGDLAKADNLETKGLYGGSETIEGMLGSNRKLDEALEAAQFLAGGQEVGEKEIRQALYDADGDVEVAALRVYGLPEDEAGLRALRAITQVKGLAKAEEEPLPTGQDVQPATLEGVDAADQISRAFHEQGVRKINLKGKHSKGALLAKDPESGIVWLLKPGSAGPGPAAGVGEESAGQSEREAAFWHVAQKWGLENTIPETELIVIDGHAYAAIRMLPYTYQNFEKRCIQDPSLAPRALADYRDQGILHKWAILDWVCGSPDRHGMNMMIDRDDKTIALIDQGSSFAGNSFDPAYDKNSFVPFYLRAWAPKNFNHLPLRVKLDHMPQVSEPTRKVLKEWLDSIHAEDLEAILNRYGINPGPSGARLAKVKVTASFVPVDQAIDRLWVTT